MAQSTRTALAWSFAERYVSLAVTMVSTVVIARLLTPAQIGVFSLCAAVMGVASTLRDFGVSEYLIQEKDLTADKLRGAFAIAIAVAWSIAAVVFAGRGWVASYYAEPGVAAVLGVLVFNLLVLPFASPAFALFNREMAFRKVFLIQMASSVVQSSTAIALAWSGLGAISLAWASFAAIAAQVVIVTLLRPRDTFIAPSLRAGLPVLRFGLAAVSSRLVDTLSGNMHEFIIARVFGFTASGLFSRALGLINLFHHNVTSAIMRVAAPSLAQGYRAGQSITPAFARGTALFTCIAWPFFGAVALLAPEVIHVLFGDQWHAAAPIATIIALATMLGCLTALGPDMMLATGNVKRRLWISTVFGSAHVALVFVCAFISLQAIAWSWVLGNTLYVGLYTWHLHVVLRARVAELFGPTLRSAAVAAASLLAQALALMACRQQALGAVATLVTVAVAGSAAWLLAVWLVRHVVFEELMRLRRHLGSRAAGHG